VTFARLAPLREAMDIRTVANDVLESKGQALKDLPAGEGDGKRSN